MRLTTALCSACSASARNLAASAFARSASASALAIWAAIRASCWLRAMFLLPKDWRDAGSGELERSLALVLARRSPEALDEDLALVIGEELRHGLAERAPAPHVHIHVAFGRFVVRFARLPCLPLGGVRRQGNDVAVAAALEGHPARRVPDGEETDEVIEVSGDEGHP